MGGFFSKPIIDTEKDVILTMCPEYYLDNSKEYFLNHDNIQYGIPYKITKKDKVTKKFYEDYFKKLLKKQHEYLFEEDKIPNRHKKIKLLNVTKKLNKIVATYKYNIEDVDLKWEELGLQDGLYKITTSGDIVFFKKINGKKVYVRIAAPILPTLTQK